jgi:beta-galactosidase/beta-glucuronidase
LSILNTICFLTLSGSLAWSQTVGTGRREEARQATPAVVNPPVRSGLRRTLQLDGPWDFAVDPKLQGEAQGWHLPGKPLPSVRKLHVSGCWEAQGVGNPGLSSAGNRLVYEPVNVKLRAAYTGAAWYKRELTVPAHWSGKQIWLKVGGVNSQGWFWVNGRYVGHDLTYCGTWKYNVTDLVQPGRQATIAVLVRNDVPSRRGESNCVRMYGGIFRGLELEATPDVLIDNVYAEPRWAQRTVRLHVALRNTTAAAPREPYGVEVHVSTWADGRAAGRIACEVAVKADPTTDLTVDVPLDPFTPWSPEKPYLYKAELVLKQSGKAIDGWVERFGVKQYEARGGDLFLNGHRYYLRATGDDHVYHMTVCSPPSREEHARHLKIMKQYGFNYVRLHTHCEIPEYFEAADEVGILLQPELPYYGRFGPDRPYSHLSGAPLMAKDDLAEVVAHYRRFTSLATYCGGNEAVCPSPLDRELRQLAHRLDPTRPFVCMDGG